MNAEYAYPEAFVWVSVIRWVALILVTTIFFTPMVREATRRGPMNAVDVALGFTNLALCMLIPRFVHPALIDTIRSELHSDVPVAWRVLHASEWETAMVIATFSAGVAAFWLLSLWMQKNRQLWMVLVYAIPVFWLSLPSLSTPIGARDNTQCRNNLKHIGLALHNDHDRSHAFPSSILKTGDIARSWRVELLPYLDQAPLRNKYDVEAAWDVAPNAAFAEKKIEQLFCPANYRPNDPMRRFYAAYAGVVGPQAFFAEDGIPRTIQSVTDGMSNTIAIVEACGAQIVWTEPRDLPLQDITVGVNLPGPKPGTSRGLISSCHSGYAGGHVLLADGAVRFLSDKVDPITLSRMLTIDAGDVIRNDTN